MATRKTKQAEDASAKLQAARALIDLPAHGVKAGEVIEADAETMTMLTAAGAVDPNPEAVAYARSL